MKRKANSSPSLTEGILYVMGGLFLVTALSSLKGSLYIKQGEPFELEVHKETQPVSIEMRDDSISIQTRKELTAPELDKASEDKINE